MYDWESDAPKLFGTVLEKNNENENMCYVNLPEDLKISW